MLEDGQAKAWCQRGSMILFFFLIFYFIFFFFLGGGVLIFLCSPFHQAIYLCISIYLFSTLIIELNIKLKLAVILFIFSCLKEVNS